MRIQKEYHKKIEEIEKEHFDGLFPMVERMKVNDFFLLKHMSRHWLFV